MCFYGDELEVYKELCEQWFIDTFKYKKGVKRKMAKDKPTYKKITTPPFRVSFPEVFEARSFQGSDPKFSIQMLFPKETTDMSVMKSEVKRLAQEKFGKKRPKGFTDPIKDGDELTDSEDEEIESTKGFWVVRAASKRKPGIIDKDKNLITAEEADEFYPGCWARATLNAFAYDTKGNKGVSFGLNNIQKLKDDEPFGNRTAPEDDFDDDDDSDDNEAW